MSGFIDEKKIDMKKYRKDFPFFKAIDEHNSKENAQLVYFDTSATAQRPFLVIDAMSHFYATANANPLRGLYDLSERATMAYEHSRNEVANFINAPDSSQIIFTRNTTESLNLVAYSYGLSNIHKDDEICITIMEHHSNILPWQNVCQKKGASLRFRETPAYTLFVFGNLVNKAFRILPAKTGIGDGFTIYAAAYFLAAFFNVAFYHDTLNQFVDIGIQLAAVHDFLHNTDLL